MKKNRIILDDGRYLVYYTFGKDKECSDPTPHRPEEAKERSGRSPYRPSRGGKR